MFYVSFSQTKSRPTVDTTRFILVIQSIIVGKVRNLGLPVLLNPFFLYPFQTPRPLLETSSCLFPIFKENMTLTIESLSLKPDRVTEDMVNSLLAAELNQMTTEERGAVYEQLHGVREIVHETPELQSTQLHRLEQEIQRIPNKLAYEQALEISTEYISSTAFRMMFLRTFEFDAAAAAKKLVSFVKLKRDLFGPAVSARRVFLSDMNADDIETLESGMFQALPTRDCAGRFVAGNFRTLIPSKPYKTTENAVSFNRKGACVDCEDRSDQTLTDTSFLVTDKESSIQYHGHSGR